MRIKTLIINDFRKFKNMEFKLGRYITIISGTNAVGKSTILGILGNSSELKVKEGKPLIHKQFRTEFSEIFKMSRQNDPSGSNKLTITFDNNEYRTMRTTWQYDKKSKAHRPRLIPEYLDENNKKHSCKQKWPTLFLGLSRLFPVGESEEINLKEKQYILDTNLETSFNQTYKNILSLPCEITKTSTIKIPETDTAKVWVVWLKTTGIQELIEYRIRFRSNTLDLGDHYQYKSGSDTVIGYNSYGWRSQAVPPGSGSEAMVASVKALVGRDAKQAELQEAKEKEMELKKQQQEQQRIAKETSEKKDKNSQTVSDVLDLIFNW